MANLLQKASIVLTPTAYDNGKVLCAKPSEAPYGDFDFSRNSAATRVNAQGLVENVQILSSNLVQNGDFSEEGVQEVSNGDFSNGSTDWTLGTGWSIGEDKAVADGTTNNAISQTTISSVVGKSYKIDFTIDDYVTGNIRIYFGGVFTPFVNSNGVYSFYIAATAVDALATSASGLFNGSITNISVKEVGQDWLLNGWEISENKATCDASGGALTMQQQGVLTSGKTYKITYTILDYVQGVLRFRSSPVSGDNTSGNGEHTVYIVAQNATFGLQGLNGFIGSVTNISVIEITDDTNLPRINYENGCGSWLFEPQSTNLLTYSEDFSNAYWTKSNSTITSNDAISPDGTQNAALLTDDTSTTFHRVQTSESVTSGVSYSQSVFVKKGVNRYFYLGTNNFSFWDFTFFDLENNVAVNTPSGISTEVEVLSNGWVRLKATKLSNATGFFNFCFGTSDTTTTIYTGDSTGKVHIYGAQLETLSYATSYIPTSGSTVTRNQDVCTNGGSLATINSTEGTLYAEIAALVSSGTPREITISDGTTGNRVMITYPSSNNIRVNYRVNSVNVFDRTFNTTVTDYNKIALKWKLNDFSFYVNGTEISKSTSGSVFPPNTLNTLNFDSANGGFPFFGKTKCLAVWKEALTDEALTELTTI